jgi:hypothetical protein
VNILANDRSRLARALFQNIERFAGGLERLDAWADICNKQPPPTALPFWQARLAATTPNL